VLITVVQPPGIGFRGGVEAGRCVPQPICARVLGGDDQHTTRTRDAIQLAEHGATIGDVVNRQYADSRVEVARRV